MREADGGGGNTIQGLFSSDLHFPWGYVDVKHSMYVFMFECKELYSLILIKVISANNTDEIIC